MFEHNHDFLIMQGMARQGNISEDSKNNTNVFSLL